MKKINESLPAIKPNALKIIQKILKNNNNKITIADLGSGSQSNIISGLNKAIIPVALFFQAKRQPQSKSLCRYTKLFCFG